MSVKTDGNKCLEVVTCWGLGARSSIWGGNEETKDASEWIPQRT